MIRSIALLFALGCVASPPSTLSPPPMSLTVEATPFWLGFPTTVTVSDVTPNQRVTFYATLAPPTVPDCPAELAPLCLNISDVTSLGRATADSAGMASITIEVPPNVGGATQAAIQVGAPDPSDPDTSNVLVQGFIDPWAADTDGDGALDALELLGGTDPLEEDTDGDGLGDGVEVVLWGTDPTNPDSDADGLLDGVETVLGTAPNDADSDRDGLLDGEETQFGTDPLDEDTDGDILLDGAELLLYGSSPLAADTDGGGVDDGLELYLFTDPADPLDDVDDCALRDTDRDGVDDCNDAESCDGLDNNGNGYIDEGIDCVDEPPIDDTGDTAPDSDSDIPPSTGFTVTSSPFWYGRPTTVSVTGGPPNTTVFVFGSIQPTMPVTCPSVLQGDCLDFGDARSLGRGTTDANGAVQFVVDVPGNLPVPSASLQAAAFSGGPLTTPVYVGDFIDASVTDTDGDGILDSLEFMFGTDPTRADTDGDGLDDRSEVMLHNTDPLLDDTDDDGALDGLEIGVGTDPNVEDTDGDLLPDGFELQRGLDPLLIDTDGDALMDGAEVLHHDTNPLDPDSDDGGVSDLLELLLGTDPNDALDDVGLCTLSDSDGDGISDCDEPELCDGVDNNGDGRVDEGCADTGFDSFWFDTFVLGDTANFFQDTYDTDLARETSDTSPLSFTWSEDVAPIFAVHCDSCHRTDSQGGLQYTSSADLVDAPSSIGMPLVTAFDRDNSYLWRKVTRTHLGPPVNGTGDRMPPYPLPLITFDEQLILQGWIDLGAEP